MDGVPPIIVEIVHECLQLDPSNRPTADEIAERLVKSQFRFTDSDRDENGNTKLHREVAEDQHLSLFDHEIIYKDEPVMVNAVNAFGETPLMLAKNKEAQRKLLTYQKVPRGNNEPSKDMEYFHNIDIFGTLLRLSEKEDVDTVRSLGELDLGAFPAELYEQRGDHRGQTPLHIAAKAGNAELVDALKSLNLINAGKTDELGQTALHVASRYGHVDVIKTLVDDHKALKGTDDFGNVENEVNDTLSSVNVQDEAGKTALHLAAGSGSVAAVEALLNCYGVKVNIQDKNQRSAMFDSIFGTNSRKETQLAVLQAFVKHPDVDSSLTDSNGETILHEVARKDFSGAAEVLMQQPGLQVFDSNIEYSSSPLHVAVRELSVSCVAVFVSSGKVDVNTADKYGNTPLHILARASTLPCGITEGGVASKMERVRNMAAMLVPRTDIDVNKVDSRGSTALHVAAHADNSIIARMLLARSDIELNIRNLDGATALHIAAAHDSVKVAELLLSRDDVDAGARDQLQQMPLHHAARKGSIGVAKMLLLRDDVDASAQSWRHRTPLHEAALFNSVGVAEMLISVSDVNINARDKDQITPLHLAARKNSVKVAELLLSRSDVDVTATGYEQRTPLHEATRFNGAGSGVTKLLVSRDDVDVNARDVHGETPLHQVRNVETARLLLARSDVNVRAVSSTGASNTPLHNAIECNNVEVAQTLLLRDDVNPNERNKRQETPLHKVSEASVEVAKMLLSRGDIDPNTRNENKKTPLHKAVEMNYVEFTKVLLSRDDVDPNVRNKHEETPLHGAAGKNSVEVARLLLLRSDVSADARDWCENTPLHKAAASDGYAVAEMLLSRPDVDANAVGKYGATPLHKACEFGSLKTIKVLLARSDVNPNAFSELHGTPLHAAAASNCAEAVKLLLMRSDVDANARDKNQDTPLHKAAGANSVEVLKALFARGDADPNLPNKNRQTPLHKAIQVAVEKVVSRGHRAARLDNYKAYKMLERQEKEQPKVLLKAAKFLLSRSDVDKHACSSTAETLLSFTEDKKHFHYSFLFGEFSEFIRANGLLHTSSGP